MPGGSDLPKISIVTPSFNQGKYLEKTIRSVIDQHYPNFEYIIIDGGSKDNSLEMIRKYEQYLKYWISEPDRGQSHAINKGLSHATGDLFAWLNSDDFYMPGALYKVGEALQANPDAGAVIGTGQIIDSTGRVIYYKEPPDEITIESLYNWIDFGHFMQPSSAFTRTAWEECGPLDEGIHIAFDVDYWLRMAKKGFKFAVTKELLSSALSHENAKTTAFANLMTVDISLIVIKHGGEQEGRKHLEAMAQRLSWSEGNLNIILHNPFFKAISPLIKRLYKGRIRRRDTRPAWRTGNG
jgi:glycosyltransferase involved in cell wall biosynthesis